jgi:hypothetical protein
MPTDTTTRYGWMKLPGGGMTQVEKNSQAEREARAIGALPCDEAGTVQDEPARAEAVRWVMAWGRSHGFPDIHDSLHQHILLEGQRGWERSLQAMLGAEVMRLLVLLHSRDVDAERAAVREEIARAERGQGPMPVAVAAQDDPDPAPPGHRYFRGAGGGVVAICLGTEMERHIRAGGGLPTDSRGRPDTEPDRDALLAQVERQARLRRYAALRGLIAEGDWYWKVALGRATVDDLHRYLRACGISDAYHEGHREIREAKGAKR